MLRAAQILRYYGDEGDRRPGDLFLASARGTDPCYAQAARRRRSRDPVQLPDRHPGMEDRAALVYGNAVVWKPASTVPLLAMRLAEGLDAGRASGGVLNLLIGPGADWYRHLLEHPASGRTDLYRLTGVVGPRHPSRRAGFPCRLKWAERTPPWCLLTPIWNWPPNKCCSAPSGPPGKNAPPHPGSSLPRISPTNFWNSGARPDLSVGDPTDPASHGARSSMHAARTSIRRESTPHIAQGATLAHRRATRTRRAPCRQATSLPRPFSNSPATGPTSVARRTLRARLSVRRAPSTQEAFELANDSEFGLSAALFTQDMTTGLARHR